jgi:predicted Zn-dependent protease
MDNLKVFYYSGGGDPIEVSVLNFNESINIYDRESNSFIIAYPLKGISYNTQQDEVLIYLLNTRSIYLRMAAKHDQTAALLKEITSANQSVFRTAARHRFLWLAAMIIGLFIGLYFLLITLVPYIGSAIVSKEVEVKMGSQLNDLMLSEEKLAGSFVDSAGTLKLQAFANNIKLSDNYPIRVTLVNSKILNAYALPGGFIVVYSGMIGNINAPEELAALLAHEASHVNRRHSLKSMLRNVADALVVSILFNDVSAITSTIIGNTQTLRGLDYSRSAEKEADDYGMKLMLENNIDVSGMKKLMQILQGQGDVPEKIAFLSSHPMTKKRIKAADEFIASHPQTTHVDDNLQSLFRQLKQ